MRTVLVTLLLAASALACAGAPTAEAGPAPADRLYRSKCAACHRPYPPASRSAATWGEVLPRMAAKARLSDEERARILEYLQANARP